MCGTPGSSCLASRTARAHGIDRLQRFPLSRGSRTVGSRSKFNSPPACSSREVRESGLHVERELLAILGCLQPRDSLVHLIPSAPPSQRNPSSSQRSADPTLG